MQGPTLQHKHVEIARPPSQRIYVLEEGGTVPSVSCCIPDPQSQRLLSLGQGTPSARRGGLRANIAQPCGGLTTAISTSAPMWAQGSRVLTGTFAQLLGIRAILDAGLCC